MAGDPAMETTNNTITTVKPPPARLSSAARRSLQKELLGKLQDWEKEMALTMSSGLGQWRHFLSRQ